MIEETWLLKDDAPGDMYGIPKQRLVMRRALDKAATREKQILKKLDNVGTVRFIEE